LTKLKLIIDVFFVFTYSMSEFTQFYMPALWWSMYDRWRTQL